MNSIVLKMCYSATVSSSYPSLPHWDYLTCIVDVYYESCQCSIQTTSVASALTKVAQIASPGSMSSTTKPCCNKKRAPWMKTNISSSTPHPCAAHSQISTLNNTTMALQKWFTTSDLVVQHGPAFPFVKRWSTRLFRGLRRVAGTPRG